MSDFCNPVCWVRNLALFMVPFDILGCLKWGCPKVADSQICPTVSYNSLRFFCHHKLKNHTPRNLQQDPLNRPLNHEYLIARLQLAWGSVGKVPFNFWTYCHGPCLPASCWNFPFPPLPEKKNKSDLHFWTITLGLVGCHLFKASKRGQPANKTTKVQRY